MEEKVLQGKKNGMLVLLLTLAETGRRSDFRQKLQVEQSPQLETLSESGSETGTAEADRRQVLQRIFADVVR